MNSNFYHKTLTGTEFLHQLKIDLQQCDILRFLVAYVSDKGIKAIGESELTVALRKQKSFGITSLDCAFDHNAIINLQSLVGNEVRLKLFLDLQGEVVEEKWLSLLHSKLIFIRFPETSNGVNRAVVYLGSHNWTARALNTHHQKNAEASIRIETTVSDQELSGDGTNLAARVNRHLLEAWNLKSCIPALEKNESVFHDWKVLRCNLSENGGTRGANRLEPVLTLVSVGPVSGFDFLSMRNVSIYLQINTQPEGVMVFENLAIPVIVLAWDSEKSLRAQEKPFVLIGKMSSINQTKEGGGSNNAEDTLVGFKYVLGDIARQQVPQTLMLGSRGKVQFWSLNYTGESTTKKVDGDFQPRFQVLLEILDIIPHASSNPEFGWQDGELAFSATRFVKREKLDGIALKPAGITPEEIEHEYLHAFGIREPSVPLLSVHFKGSEGLRLVAAPINKLLYSDTNTKFPALSRDRYDEIKAKGIRTTIDFEKIESEIENKVIERTKLVYQEGGKNLAEWIRELRRKGKDHSTQGKLF